MDTQHTSRAMTRRSRRGPFVALAVVLAAVAAACTPTSGGGFNIAVGGTLPLPPIAVAPAFQGGNVLGCQVGFTTPGLNIVGATVTIPGINVNPGAGTIGVNNITVNLPSIQVALPSIVVCGNPISLGTITLPAHANASGTLNLNTMTLTINATATVPITILGNTFPVSIPIGPISIHL